MVKRYHRGTQAQFDTWHGVAKIAENIPEEGRINYVNGVAAPDNQRTTEVSETTAHPSNPDDFIWLFNGQPDDVLIEYDQTEVQSFGFLPDPEE